MSLSLSTKWTENTNIKENWLFQLFNQDSYLSFDGTDDYIDLGATTSATATSLTSTTDMSIAFWIQFTGASQWIYVNNSVDNKYAGFSVYVDHEKKFSLLYGDNTGTSSSDYIRFKTTSAYSDDTWYHVAITTGFALNGSDTVFYVNGSVNSTVVASSMSTVSTPTYTSGNSYIGRANPPDPDSYGELKIKNLAIWSGIIDATNVGAIYNSGNFLSLADDSGSYDESSNLKAYWEFNNGNNKAIDLTDNISPGTISGAKYRGFLGLSFYDTALESVDYYGAILNKPSIRESINLENSTAKTSNVSLSVANFKHLDDDLSAELFGGSRNYINRPVKVYIQPNDDVDLADCLQIYNGRLTDVSHNASKLSLNISAVMPWDNISIPSDRSTITNRYFPIAYGAFTKNNTSASSQDFATSQSLYPVPVDKKGGEFIYCLSPRDYDSSSGHDARLHYYEPNLDIFVPILLTTSTFVDDPESYQGGYAVRCASDLERAFKTKPINYSSDDASTNPENAFDIPRADNLTGTYATLTNTINYEENTSYDSSDYLRLDPPNIIGKLTELKVKVGYNKSYTDDDDGGTQTVTLTVGDSNVALSGSGNQNATLTATTGYTNNNDQIPKIEIRDRLVYVAEAGEEGSSVTTVKIFDVQIWVKVKLDTASTDTTEIAKGEIDKVKTMYIGANGLADNGWNSSGTITEIHEAHRDLLHRHTSYTKSNTPTNWSSGTNINGSKDWDIRYWLSEPTPLIDVLNKLQMEGGFIGRFNGQGDYQYIYLPDSPSADHTLTKDDIEDIDLSITPISSLVTKMDIEYAKHPAEDRYLSNATSTNSTTRLKYNIKSAENIKSVKLDANVSAPSTTPGSASGKNDDFYRYYDWILGTPKIIVQGTIVNPKYMGVDVGDIVGFSDMQVDPFGESWSGKTFMVTSTQRTPGKLNFTAREI